jgi:hypothetical protein
MQSFSSSFFNGFGKDEPVKILPVKKVILARIKLKKSKIIYSPKKDL